MSDDKWTPGVCRSKFEKRIPSPSTEEEVLAGVLKNEHRISQAPNAKPWKYVPPEVNRHDKSVAEQAVNALRIQAEEAKKLTPLGKSILGSNRRHKWVRNSWFRIEGVFQRILDAISEYVLTRFGHTDLVTDADIDKLVANTIGIGGPSDIEEQLKSAELTAELTTPRSEEETKKHPGRQTESQLVSTDDIKKILEESKGNCESEFLTGAYVPRGLDDADEDLFGDGK